MNNMDVSYPVRIRNGFPGWDPVGYKETIAKRDAEKEAAVRWAERADRLKKAGNANTADMREALDNFDKHRAEYERLEKAIFSGDAFADQSIDNLEYTPSAYGFSFGDLSGRRIIDANRGREPMDLYNDTAIAEEVAEGTDSTPKNLTDSLSMISSDSEERLHFDDILQIGTGVYNDDPKTLGKAFKSAHIRHFVNAENAKSVAILTGCKDPVDMSAASLETAVNANLCGKAKRNAVIVTNKSGFGKLDTDGTTGHPLVTRNSEGDFIYKGKYQIIELPDEIFPNTDTGAPCIIGDVKGVLRFFIVRETSMFRDDLFPYLCGSRVNRVEIITLSSESNEAYIWGNLE